MKIRIARQADLVQIVEIYNQAVALKSATADLDPVEPGDRVRWLEEHVPEKYPIYVAEVDGKVVAWCSLSPYRRGRMALRYTAEISYYIHGEYRRMGIGSALVQHATSQCEKLGIKTLLALVLDVNVASTKLLEKLGFARWGHMPKIADFEGRECGHLVYGLRVC
ncbi:MAG: N-acetyltransferase [Anaerolineae bacterium]|nr:N-acetyltransferase [Anaerolineae bacterium]